MLVGCEKSSPVIPGQRAAQDPESRKRRHRVTGFRFTASRHLRMTREELFRSLLLPRGAQLARRNRDDCALFPRKSRRRVGKIARLCRWARRTRNFARAEKSSDAPLPTLPIFGERRTADYATDRNSSNRQLRWRWLTRPTNLGAR